MIEKNILKTQLVEFTLYQVKNDNKQNNKQPHGGLMYQPVVQPAFFCHNKSQQRVSRHIALCHMQKLQNESKTTKWDLGLGLWRGLQEWDRTTGGRSTEEEGDSKRSVVLLVDAYSLRRWPSDTSRAVQLGRQGAERWQLAAAWQWNPGERLCNRWNKRIDTKQTYNAQCHHVVAVLLLGGDDGLDY